MGKQVANIFSLCAILFFSSSHFLALESGQAKPRRATTLHFFFSFPFSPSHLGRVIHDRPGKVNEKGK